LGNSNLRQLGEGEYDGLFHNIGAELSYEIDTLNLITANYSYYGAKNKNEMNQLVEYRDGGNNLIQSYNRYNNSKFSWFGGDLGLDYQKTFKKNKEQILTVSYKMNRGGNGNGSDFLLDPILNYEKSISTTDMEGISNEHTAQVDYVHPLKALTIETGVKSIFRLNKSDYYYKNFNQQTQEYEIDDSQSNLFEYHQDIYSGYASLSYKKDKWGFKGGIRAEETKINADFRSSESKAKQDYFNIVPSITLSRNITQTSTLRFSYNQRIQRPGLWHLNPYVNRVDPKNIYSGNPNLKASVSNNFDLNYSTFVKGSSFNASVYYNFTNNSILNYTSVGEDSVSKTAPQNIGENKTLGVSINSNINLTKKLSLYLNLNSNYLDFTSEMDGKTLSNTGVSGFLSGNLSYNFNKGWRAGSNGGVGLPRVELQGSSNSFFYYNFSLSKKLLKDKFNISASATNPFQKTRKMRFELEDTNFHQVSESWYQIRRFNVSLSYNFGKLQGGIAKKKRGIQNDDVKAGEGGGGN
jgi:outer membrane receptor protein involved in Fe transport